MEQDISRVWRNFIKIVHKENLKFLFSFQNSWNGKIMFFDHCKKIFWNQQYKFEYLKSLFYNIYTPPNASLILSVA